MKKILAVIGIFAASIAIFSAGWYLGQRSTVKIASNVIQTSEFDMAFTGIAENEVILEAIDSGRIEDAKRSLCLTLSGEIFSMENAIGSSNSKISLADLTYLNEIEKWNHKSPLRETADKALARVELHRTAHSWTFPGGLTEAENTKLAAKLDSILKQAGQRVGKAQN